MLVLDVKTAVSQLMSSSDSAIVLLSLPSPFLTRILSSSQLRIGIDRTFKLISFDNSEHTYGLAAIIYYANLHFTAQIITRDGRIWFYNGMEIINPSVQLSLEHGFIRSHTNLNICKGGNTCAVIYSRVRT
jgi:hypothetical protein